MFSFPRKKISNILIPKMKHIKISTYTTTPISIFCGLIYLSKFKNCVTSLKIINDKEILKCSKYCDLHGFQINWINSKLFIPFDNLEQKIFEYKVDYFIIPLGIQIINNDIYLGHSNILIVDLKNMECYRIEPYGKFSFDYNSILLDNLLEMQFKNFKYISPDNILPKIWLQLKEINEYRTKSFGVEADGFCSAWCIFFCYIVINNPKLSIDKIVFLLDKEIINNQMSYSVLIKNFSYNITKIRDEILNKAKISIENYENDKISKNQIDIINNLLTEYCI